DVPGVFPLDDAARGLPGAAVRTGHHGAARFQSGDDAAVGGLEDTAQSRCGDDVDRPTSPGNAECLRADGAVAHASPGGLAQIRRDADACVRPQPTVDAIALLDLDDARRVGGDDDRRGSTWQAPAAP